MLVNLPDLFFYFNLKALYMGRILSDHSTGFVQNIPILNTCFVYTFNLVQGCQIYSSQRWVIWPAIFFFLGLLTEEFVCAVVAMVGLHVTAGDAGIED